MVMLRQGFSAPRWLLLHKRNISVSSTLSFPNPGFKTIAGSKYAPPYKKFDVQKLYAQNEYFGVFDPKLIMILTIAAMGVVKVKSYLNNWSIARDWIEQIDAEEKDAQRQKEAILKHLSSS